MGVLTAIKCEEIYDINDLIHIMERLRGPGGCPWDREQTHISIRRNFIEETYEAVQAIDNGDTALLKEELGDVLLQVMFHAQLGAETGDFDFADVCDGVCRKLIRRHPHVFGEKTADTSTSALKNWEEAKKAEKPREPTSNTLNGISRSLPSLMRSEEVQSKAAKSGFDYPSAEWAMRDMHSEVKELIEAIDGSDKAAVEEELGDLLFSVVNVARFAKADPEHCLAKACDKFISRFEQVEKLAAIRGVDIKTADINLLDCLWQDAKK